MLFIIWSLLFLIIVLIASLIIRFIIKSIREKLTPSNLHTNNLIAYLGFFELLSYSVSLVISKPEFIAVWLGVKSLNRWKEKTENKEVNIFLFGNLLNVILSFFVGYIALKMGISLNVINFNSNGFFNSIFR